MNNLFFWHFALGFTLCIKMVGYFFNDGMGALLLLCCWLLVRCRLFGVACLLRCCCSCACCSVRSLFAAFCQLRNFCLCCAAQQPFVPIFSVSNLHIFLEFWDSSVAAFFKAQPSRVKRWKKYCMMNIYCSITCFHLTTDFLIHSLIYRRKKRLENRKY